MPRAAIPTRALAVLPVLLLPATAGASEPEPDAAARRGLDLLHSKGCIACHSTDGTARAGPTLLGQVGRTRTVSTGGTKRRVMLDEQYLRRSLEEPDADVVEGFAAGTMPKWDLTDGEVADILSALRHLSRPGPARKPVLGSIVASLASAAAFAGLHLTMSSAPIRSPIVRKLGERPFQGIYSLIVLGAFAWMLLSWSHAPYVELWPSPVWTRYFPLVLMPFVYVLLVASFVTKNPTAAGMEKVLDKDDAVRGFVKITRHPMLWSMALWGVVHMPPNGDLGSVALFGSIVVLAVGGMVHIDRRRRRAHGERWAAFERQTSLVPFVAMLQGRTRFTLRDLGVVPILGGLACYGLTLLTHVYVVGASPLP